MIHVKLHWQNIFSLNEKHRSLKYLFPHLLPSLRLSLYYFFQCLNVHRAASQTVTLHFLPQIKQLRTFLWSYSSFTCPHGIAFDSGKYCHHIILVSLAKRILLNSVLLHTWCETKRLANFFPCSPWVILSGISQYIPKGKRGSVTTTVAEAILWEETPYFREGQRKTEERRGRQREGQSALSGVKTISNTHLFVGL